MWMRRRILVAALCILLGPQAWGSQATERKDGATILVVGDSLSAEYGLKRGSGWVDLIKTRLKNLSAGYQIQNASISGDTTSGGLARLKAALTEYQPDIVIIELGGNDALRGLPLDMAEKNIAAMTEMAKERGAAVLLVGMQIPPNYGRRYADQFRDLFGKIAEQRETGLVPFLLEGIETDVSMFQADGIHPNEQAQPIMAENVWRHLEPMLRP